MLKGDDKEGLSYLTPGSGASVQEEGGHDCRKSLIRAYVRLLGSYSAVEKDQRLPSLSSQQSEYALGFAKRLYQLHKNEDELIELSATPLRKAKFIFPLPPDDEMPINVRLRMKPASGRAQIELVPRNKDFLRNQKVFLDYSTMRGASSIPRQGRGFPSVQELLVHPTDFILKEFRAPIEFFLTTKPTDPRYQNAVDEVKKALCHRGVYSFLFADLPIRVVDQDGLACTESGQLLVQSIAEKFEQDFCFVFDRDPNSKLLDRIFTRASWLWGSTPSVIVEHVVDVLKSSSGTSRWNWAVEAGARSFLPETHQKFLISKIVNRVRTDGAMPIPINAARALCYVLMYRKSASLHLNCDDADVIASSVVERLKDETKNNKYMMLFFQLVLLLLYLLRVRENSSDCFDRNIKGATTAYDDACDCLESAAKYLGSTHYEKAQKALKIKSGIEKYIDYSGSEDVVTVLKELANE